MSSISISDHVVQVLNRLETADESLEAKLRRVLENEIRRRLAHYELVDRLFQKKYGMTLEEFEKKEMVRRLGYSFEAESDHQDWDIAVDGIKTLRAELARLRGQT